MHKKDRQTSGGLIADIFGEDDEGYLRHQPEVAERLNALIDLHRGKSYEDLKRALANTTDEMEKEAICIYSVGHFKKDPMEDIEESNQTQTP